MDRVPYRLQDSHEVAQMLRGLEDNKGKGKGRAGFSCKKSSFAVDGTDITVDSWRMQDWDYKKPNLPTYARGLFTTIKHDGEPEIVVRGYDKFFNHGEVRETEWQNVEQNSRGPYELSVKENGCIIFISGLEDGTLLVCSKHSTGDRADTDVSHAKAGEKWVDKQLASIGRTRRELAMILRAMNATALAELCDDEFEEHVLAYSPEAAGLYLHGINLNLPEFATYPHHVVDRFAEEWGFKKTTYLIMESLSDVKEFLDRVAETGHYHGRDTEGFVIRCQSKASTGQWHDWFFKYKFEEPYLMYRQWRECTKALISGRQPTFKKHKKITEEYILFARKQFHANPGLVQAYSQNHGIIKMRNEFLASRNLKGSDVIRQEEEEGDVAYEGVTKDVVLVPVATIGCGKTTLALALCRLFNWGHIQNDDITVKKGKPKVFATRCTNSLTKYCAMVADRNNHQKRERKQLIEDVSKVVPNVHFVCLHYLHERSNYEAIRETTRARVLSRGDNHQTIHTSKGQQEIIGIMEGFLERFEPVDQESLPDDGFDVVIGLDPCADTRENLETVITRMYAMYPKLFGNKDMPTVNDMDAAVEIAIKDYTADMKHEIRSGESHGQMNRTATPKEREAEYFAVQVPTERINEILAMNLRDAKPEIARMYNMLKTQRRIQSEFHVTLIHRAQADDFPEYWARLSATYDRVPLQNKGWPKERNLGSCKVRLERLVWDERLMVFVVRLSPAEEGGEMFGSVNDVAHITVGTASPNIKPKESNDLLAKWLREGNGRSGVAELVIKGDIELDGLVRGAFQRQGQLS